MKMLGRKDEMSGELGAVIRVWNPDASVAEVGRSAWAWGQHGLGSEFQSRLRATKQDCGWMKELMI